MKTYTVTLEESIVYKVHVVAHSTKEAEVEALRHPEKWVEVVGQINTTEIKQGD